MKIEGNATPKMVWEIYEKVFLKYWKDGDKYSFIYEKYGFSMGMITFREYFTTKLSQRQLNNLYKDLLELKDKKDENNK